MTRFTKERMKEIRDFDTCVTLEESAELARIALASLEADSDSHPAHGPVSLDRLHRIREILSKAAAQRDGGNIGYAMSDAVKAIDELLEVRKAEPVAWMVRGIDTGEKVIRPDRSYFEGSCQPLYTAPPVPVTIDERAAFNAWNNEDNLPIAGVGAKNAAWLAWQARAKLGSPPAPVVPATLPCDVELKPGLIIGKGCKTETLLTALQRRADYYAEIDAMTPEDDAMTPEDDAMTPEERAEHDANIEAFKAMLPHPVPDERKAFEAFMDKRFGDTIDQSRAKNGDQGYMAWDMVVAWIVWQGRATMLNHSCDVTEMGEAIKQQSTMHPSNGSMSGDAVKQSSSNAQRR